MKNQQLSPKQTALKTNNIDLEIFAKNNSYIQYLLKNQKNILLALLFILILIQKIMPYPTLIILPLFLGLASLLLFQHLLKKFNFSEQFSFFFTLFLIISPTIILEFSNITFNLFFLFFTLLTFYLLSSEKKHQQY